MLTMDKEQINPNIGDIIKFGGYDWRVLDTQDDKALLLSDKIVGRIFYHKPRRHEKTTWAECNLRSYLNSRFYVSLSKDKARIVETKIITSNNIWYGTDGGATTSDRVFLLSIEEVIRYFGDSGQLKSRPDNDWRIDDKFNAARLATNERGEALWWWLRSPGLDSDHVVFVSSDGTMHVHGTPFINDPSGVRPALWLNL